MRCARRRSRWEIPLRILMAFLAVAWGVFLLWPDW